MISGFVIMLRESLEALLITGIIAGFLVKSGNNTYIKHVVYGCTTGILVSIILGIILNRASGGFEGTNEALFEGVVMIAGAVLLTTMIIWMMNQSRVAQDLRAKTRRSIEGKKSFALFFVVFLAILREGVESVIFLAAVRYAYSNARDVFTGAIFGILVSLVLGYIIFLSSKKMKIKAFFLVSNILLIAFAAGLIAHGIHELQEAGVVPKVVEHIWDINPAVAQDGSYPPLHENGYIGSILKGLFGYNGNPSLIEAVSYALYIALILLIKDFSRIGTFFTSLRRGFHRAGGKTGIS